MEKMFSYATRNKGKSLLKKLTDYVVLDLETSGMNTYYDDIIEVGALRVRNGLITERFQKLIKPRNRISSFITSLTGITNSMLKSAGEPGEVLPQFIDFIGSDIVVGHNVNFDINFIYDKWELMSGSFFTNDYLDTLRVARKVLPDLCSHKLEYLKSHYRINVQGAHRSIADCETTYHAYLNLMKDADRLCIDFEAPKTVRASSFKPDENADPASPVYGKTVVISKSYSQKSRLALLNFIARAGGINRDSLSGKTDYLICESAAELSGSPMGKKAKELSEKGKVIKILNAGTLTAMIMNAVQISKK